MIRAILFDKDGTLFDFQATWASFAHALIAQLAGDDGATAGRLERVLGFDRAAGRFSPDSMVIGHTTDEIAQALAVALPDSDAARLSERMNAMAAAVAPVPACALGPLMEGLRGRGLRLGVATNDTESAARAHLQAAGVETYFDFIAGYDSGHGAKPAAGMLVAFARRFALSPAEVAMVGDSPHDLRAGKAAGMRRIAVLTGPMSEIELAPLADAVLPHIGHLPLWLDRQAAPESAT